MPFGAVYAALFLGLFGSWLVLAPVESPVGSFLLPRLALACISLPLAAGLLLRRRWARWGAALFCVALALLSLRLVLLGLGAAPLLFLFGSVTAAVLLVVPPTGWGGPARTPVAPRLGRGLAWAAVAGVVVFAASLTFVELPPGAGEATAGPGSASAAPAASRNDRVRWTDFGGGLERALSQGRPIVANFVTNWCGYCKKMDRTTWRDPAVVERLAGLVAVRVDAEEQRERNGFTGLGLAERFGVHGTPALLLLDENGSVLARTSGYHDPRQFLDWLGRALERSGTAPSTSALQTSAP